MSKTSKLEGKRKTIQVYPGDPLPQGIYINGWKLERNNKSDTPRALYLILQEDTTEVGSP